MAALLQFLSCKSLGAQQWPPFGSGVTKTLCSHLPGFYIYQALKDDRLPIFPCKCCSHSKTEDALAQTTANLVTGKQEDPVSGS